MNLHDAYAVTDPRFARWTAATIAAALILCRVAWKGMR